jgi:hypothetical protein
MPLTSRCALHLLLTMVLAGQPSAFAQGTTSAPADVAAPAPSDVPRPSTGKERLGGKWTDEQRLDNCKVPLDKRGSRPRPDTCAHVPSG